MKKLVLQRVFQTSLNERWSDYTKHLEKNQTVCPLRFWKPRAALLTNQKQNQNRSQFGRTRFPALQGANPFFLWVLLAILSPLALVERHPVQFAQTNSNFVFRLSPPGSKIKIYKPLSRKQTTFKKLSRMQHRCPKLTFREKANDRFMKASRVVWLGVKLREEPLRIWRRYKE